MLLVCCWLVVGINRCPQGGGEQAWLLDVGEVPGVVDQGEWPAELGGHALRVDDRDEPVVAATDHGHGHVDSVQLRGVDRQRQGAVGVPRSRVTGSLDQVVLDRGGEAPKLGAGSVGVDEQVSGDPICRGPIGVAAEANQSRPQRQGQV